MKTEKSEEVRHYIETILAHSDDEEFAVWGYVQLMFLASSSRQDRQTKAWASGLLDDLGLQNPQLHREAEETWEQITSGTSSSGKERRQIGYTDIN
jgi:hypothetical protein